MTREDHARRFDRVGRTPRCWRVHFTRRSVWRRSRISSAIEKNNNLCSSAKGSTSTLRSRARSRILRWSPGELAYDGSRQLSQTSAKGGEARVGARGKALVDRLAPPIFVPVGSRLRVHLVAYVIDDDAVDGSARNRRRALRKDRPPAAKRRLSPCVRGMRNLGDVSIVGRPRVLEDPLRYGHGRHRGMQTLAVPRA